MAFEDFYNANPVAVIDQNLWDDRHAEVVMQFQTGPTIYTPLIIWTNESQQSGAASTIFSELIEGDVDNDDISFDTQYLKDPLGVDSRSRKLRVSRYADKVQFKRNSNFFQMWKLSGGRDWKPIMRSLLASNIVRKIEVISRNSFLTGPMNYWSYPGDGEVTDFSGLDSAHTFNLRIVNEWNMRMGNIGTPVVPGASAAAKLAVMPPGCVFDFFESLAAASATEASMWRDLSTVAGTSNGLITGIIGSYKNVLFQEVPNDRYGMNSAVLYNAGNIAYQCGVSAAIKMGDGAPNPESVAVDDVWYVGQKQTTHYIQLEDDADMTEFKVNDLISIGIKQTAVFGITGGNDFRSGKTIVRRIKVIDVGAKRLSFDRPVMRNYTDLLIDDDQLNPVSTAAGDFYAVITKATHVGFILVMGQKGGVMGNVNTPIDFHEPAAVDDLQMVWRFSWDMEVGYNMWDPSLFECHFVAVSVAKPGGIIKPPAPAGS